MGVFNDNPPTKKPKLRLGYGTANRARRSVKLLKNSQGSIKYKLHKLYTIEQSIINIRQTEGGLRQKECVMR